MKTAVLSIAAALMLPTAARAQFSIDWYTIDGGGGVSSGGTFELHGTIGQHDAGTHTGGSFGLAGGFWATSPPSGGCYADCDSSTGPAVLDIFDFLCFQNRYAALEPYACDCDTSSGPLVCDIFDFLCFQNAFAAGCP